MRCTTIGDNTRRTTRKEEVEVGCTTIDNVFNTDDEFTITTTTTTTTGEEESCTTTVKSSPTTTHDRSTEDISRIQL